MLVVAIDAGGTRCRVNLATKEDGVIASASLGPCNYTTLGLKSAVDQLQRCFEAAKSRLPNPSMPVSALVLGMAGLDRDSDIRAITPHLADMFSLDPSDKSRFIVGNDATLLSLPMLDDQHAGGIAVVAGTGSVVFAFTKDPKTGIPVAARRAGGYGALLGDPGSGFHIGQLAIVSTLAAFDAQSPLSQLHRDVIEHFNCWQDPQLLLARVYEQDSAVFPDVTPTGRIASTCKVVMRRCAMGDGEALGIIRTAVPSLTDLVAKLSASKDSPQTLVLGGGLFSEDSYKAAFLSQLQREGLRFARTVVVDDTGKTAAEIMARRVE